MKTNCESESCEYYSYHSAGVEEIEDVNGLQECNKSVRLPQLTNCVRGNDDKYNG